MGRHPTGQAHPVHSTSPFHLAPWHGGYLFLEEALTLLLKLAERVKATSISGTSTTTWGLCTKPRPLWTQTCRRLSRTSRVPPSSRPVPYERHRIQRKSPAWP